MQPDYPYEISYDMEIEALLDNMLLQRDIFRPNIEINIWKSAYTGIYGLSTLLQTQLSQKIWHGTEIESELKHLKKTTNRFIRSFRKRGKNHGKWTGCSEDCKELLHCYQERCQPFIQKLVEKLDEDHPIRKDIEEKLPQLS